MSTQRVLRTDFSRVEAIGGLVWLSVGAVFSLFVEILYLGTWIGPIPVPWTIAAALLFNAVLTTTAKLWSDHLWVHLIPLIVWSLGFLIALAGADALSAQLLGNNFRTIALLFGGIAGGVWPVIRPR